MQPFDSMKFSLFLLWREKKINDIWKLFEIRICENFVLQSHLDQCKVVWWKPYTRSTFVVNNMNSLWIHAFIFNIFCLKTSDKVESCPIIKSTAYVCVLNNNRNTENLRRNPNAFFVYDGASHFMCLCVFSWSFFITFALTTPKRYKIQPTFVCNIICMSLLVF